MRRVFAAATLALLFAGYEAQHRIREPQTREDRVRLEEEVMNAFPSWIRKKYFGNIPALGTVNFKCDGQPSLFAVIESPDGTYAYIQILDSIDGKLSPRSLGGLNYRKGKEIDKIIRTDKGNDGCEEVELFLSDGERRIYHWNGGSYMQAGLERSTMQVGREIYYRDIDGDGTEESILIREPYEQELFRVYRWHKSGWVSYKPKELERFASAYRNINPNLDALALKEQREVTINELRAFLGSQ